MLSDTAGNCHENGQSRVHDWHMAKPLDPVRVAASDGCSFDAAGHLILVYLIAHESLRSRYLGSSLASLRWSAVGAALLDVIHHHCTSQRCCLWNIKELPSWCSSNASSAQAAFFQHAMLIDLALYNKNTLQKQLK